MGVMKPECRKFLRDNRFAAIIDGFVEKDVLTLIDLVDFCAGKRAIKQIESMGTDLSSATKLVELVRRNAVKWKKAENGPTSFAQPKPLKKDTLAFLAENKLEMFAGEFSNRGISRMQDLKNFCTKSTSLDELIGMGMKRMQARNLVNSISKKKIKEPSPGEEEEQEIMEEESPQPKLSSKEYEAIAKQKKLEEAQAIKKEKAQKIADAKAAKIAASNAEMDEWKRKVNDRVSEAARFTGILEVVTGVGFFGREVRQPRYALYDRESNTLELFLELGSLKETLVVEVGSALEGGAAGPLRRRFLLQVNTKKESEPEIMETIFHVYTPKDAAAWALVLNDGKEGKSKEMAETTIVIKDEKKKTDTKKNDTKTSTKETEKSEKKEQKKERRTSAADLAERAAERKLATEKRKQAKIEEEKQKKEKAEAKELMKKKKNGNLSKDDKKRLKELKHIKRSKSFEGVPEEEDEQAGEEEEPKTNEVKQESDTRFSVGERIFALYKGDGHWYAATVSQIHANLEGEEIYDVDYEGFSDEDKVDLGLTLDEVAPASDFEEEPAADEEEVAVQEETQEGVLQEVQEEVQEEEPEAVIEPMAEDAEDAAEATDTVPDIPVEAAAAPEVIEDSLTAHFKKQLSESSDLTTDSNSTSGNTNLSAKEAKKLEKEEKKRRKTELKLQQKDEKEREKQEKLAAIERAKQEKLDAIQRAKDEKEREKQEKLAAIERAKQEKLDAIQRAKDEKEREKQEKLAAIERAKQEKLDAIQRAKDEKEREKQEKLAAIAREKQEKLDAIEQAKQEKINAKRRATQLKQEESQAKLEAKEREKTRIAEEKAEKARLKKEASMRK